METTTGATAEGNNQQNNVISNMNIGGGYFLHFKTIRGFGAFRNNNNNPPLGNNNNNNPPPLPSLLSPGFGGGFNPLPGGNAGGLDPNIAALVNILTGANLAELSLAEPSRRKIKQFNWLILDS